MPVLLFLVDTSASMNQRSHLGTTYLDIAKGAVETFMKVLYWRDSSARVAFPLFNLLNLFAKKSPTLGFKSSLLSSQLRGRDPASRGDRYMLVNYEDIPYGIKVEFMFGSSRLFTGRD